MLIDRTHKSWFVLTAVLSVVAVALYLGVSRLMPHGVTGGSLAGLLFGVVGSAMMIFAALLAIRKRLPTWRVGSAQWWLRGHLWLGSLGFLFILFHSGFGWGGPLELCLWLSFGLVILTGFLGVALQQVIPRLLTTQVPLETMVAQIPFLSRTNLFRADQLVAKQAGLLDVPFESLKPFAEEVLKQQRVLKRDSDFPKELAKVYANVPLPEPEAKKPHAATEAAGEAGAKPSPLAQMKAATKPIETTTAVVTETSPPTDAPAAAPAKPKSPLELMREKAAAKAEVNASSAPSTPATEVPPVANKPLSPLEQMKAKLAAQKGSSSDKPADTPKPLTVELAKPAAPASEPVANAAPVAPPPVKKPAPVMKPPAAAVPPVLASPPKPKPVLVIPPAALAELREFHLRAVRPFLHSGHDADSGLSDVLASRRVFGQLKADLPSELHETLDQLEAWCEERRQFNVQRRLHRWLHVWLLFHVPPSIALLVLFVAHVVVSLRVVPWER